MSRRIHPAHAEALRQAALQALRVSSNSPLARARRARYSGAHKTDLTTQETADTGDGAVAEGDGPE